METYCDILSLFLVKQICTVVYFYSQENIEMIKFYDIKEYISS